MDVRSLTDDVLFYVMDLLNVEDSLLLGLADERFFDLYKRRVQYKRSLNFEKCYNLTSDLFRKLTRQFPLQHLRRFNVAGCCWLPAKTLLKVIRQMANLEELLANDTKIDLNDVCNIFRHCPKLAKLSFSFDDTFCFKPYYNDMAKALWRDDDARSPFHQFSRLKSLKITCHGFPKLIFRIVVLRILKWCIGCDDVHIEWNLLSSVNHNSHIELDKENDYKNAVCHIVEQSPWMRNLRSFVFIARVYNEGVFDDITFIFLNYLFQRWRPQLERFIVGQEVPNVDFGASILSPKKSWKYFGDTSFDIDCRSLAESSGISFKKLKQSPKIQTCNIECENIDDFTDHLIAFLRSHSNLKEIYMSMPLPPAFFLGDVDCHFQLPQLESLGIVVDGEGNQDHLIANCPNVRELAVSDGGALDCLTKDMATAITKLEKLRILKAGIGQFQPLQMVVEECKQIECLHLWRNLENSDNYLAVPFSYGIENLSLPGSVRELAIQWDIKSPYDDWNYFGVSSEMSFVDMLSAAKRWTGLKILILQKGSRGVGKFCHFAERTLEMLSQLKELRFMCLIGDFSKHFAQKLRKSVKESIQRHRPYFRFYVGPELYHTYYPYQ